ncbi:enoyl-CoA hydratase-related protein [Craterilacuibacter sp.]|uniref:enoyl-CoA hydratase-related protein n=1 Tax=Craterilacuibacter sp. TaxID=2870909 RepID=UPI003F3B5061
MSKVLTHIDGRVLLITINRPEVRNALDSETHRLMSDALDAYAADDELWLCVLRGAGGQAFCAGGDIGAMHAAANGGEPYVVPASGYGGLTSRFDLDKTVIAVVDGIAMGGGFEIALACDLVIAGESARFALPEPKIGAVAYAGGMHRLPRQIGMKRAMQLLLTGDSVHAAQALDWGLINEVVPDAELDAALARWTGKLTACAPLAIRATKACVSAGLDLPLAAALARQDTGGIAALETMRTSRDVIEGIAAFSEKRKPQWQGR